MNQKKNLLPTDDLRPVIGYVTSATWSPKAGTSVGIGVCVSSALWSTLCIQGSRMNCIVVIRNNSSTVFARLTVLEM